MSVFKSAVLLEPIDVAMFRDGRPFDAGNDGNARTNPTPSPSTIAASVVAAFGTGVGRVSGPLLASWDDGTVDLRLPTPRDLVRPERVNGHHQIAQRLRWNDGQVVSDLGSQEDHRRASVAVPTNDVGGDPVGGFISAAGLSSYLAGDAGPALGEAGSQRIDSERPARERRGFVTQPERHTGLALADEDAPDRTGFFYVAEFLRLHHQNRRVGYVALTELEPDSVPLSTVVALGGESRRAAVSIRPIADLKLPPPPEVTSPQTLMYLANPAVYKHGWRPPLDLSVGLNAAVVGGPDCIAYGRVGAWNSARAVSPGSLYLLEHKSVERAQMYVQERHGDCIEQANDDLRRRGFGLTLFGVLT
jgi:CRISPR-associated protein Cmr3